MIEKKEKEAIRVWKQRKEVINLRSEGMSIKKIAGIVGVSADVAQGYLTAKKETLAAFTEIAPFENELIINELSIGINRINCIKNPLLKAIIDDYMAGVASKDIAPKHNISSMTYRYIVSIVIDKVLARKRAAVISQLKVGNKLPKVDGIAVSQKEKYRAAKVDEWDFGNEQFIPNDGVILELRRW